MLSEKENTIVGERGVTLSGGQKARIVLARCIYREADIYLFDDPFSSLDYNTARKIFKNCIKLLSRSKTVLLVTHELNYLEQSN